jgi:hypothetical protein
MSREVLAVTQRSRAWLSAVSALALTLGLLVAAASPASADDVTDARRAEAGAELLNKNARQFDEPIRTTVSQLYDYLLAFAAAGQPNSASPDGRAWYLLDALEQRSSFAEGSATTSPVKISGASTPAVTSFADVSQVLHAAAVYDQDPADFADRDFVGLLEGFRFNGEDPSWYRTTATGSARVSTQLQARAVLGLAAAGEDDKASAAASSLAARQLPSGAWATSYTSTAASFEHTVNAVLALAAEGSEASLAAAGAGADHLVGLQQGNGSFTGGTTPVLAGQAANALRAVGRAEAADRAAAYVATLQVVDVEGVDPLFNGGIAATTAARAQIEAGTFSPLNFATLATNNVRGILAFAPALGTLHVDEPEGERPTVEGNDTFHEGACEATEGVTVVIDYGYVAPDGMEDPVVSCALGTQASGWAALENAGIAVGSVPGFVGGALCQLNGVPTQGYPYCWTGDGYWSYWHDEPGDMWNYSQLGASNRAPGAGSVEGWRFVPLAGAGVPPRVGPTFAPGIDTTAPKMAFQSGPSGTVDGGHKLHFTWSLDDLGATLECRLDDAAWGPCDEPSSWDATSQQHTLYDVANGDHVFEVRATDPWDNSSIISRSFAVVSDVNAPAVAITRTPGTLTNVRTASFAMTVDDADATVECRLDDGEWVACGSRTSQSYAGLDLGEHTFSYRATDLAGNVGAVSHTWIIAADAPPVVTITSGTAAYTSTISNASAYFSIAEAGTVESRECRLDDGEWGACYSSTRAYWTGVSLTDGEHTISVRATNADGRTSEVAVHRFTVDTVKPVVQITSRPSATTTSRDARIEFDVAETSPLQSLTCDIDGAGARDCTSPVDLTGLSLGEHSVRIQARDVAFLWGDAVTVAWTVEREAATATAPEVVDVTTSSATVTSSVTAGNVDQTVVVEVDGPGDADSTTAAQPVEAGSTHDLTFDLTDLPSHGEHRVRLVLSSADSEVVHGEWVQFTTLPVRAGLGTPSAGVVSPEAVTVTVAVTAGDLDQQVSVEYAAGADPTGAVRTSPQVVSAGGEAVDVAVALDHLAARTTYSYRVVAVAEDGAEIASDWQSFTTPAHTAPSVSVETDHTAVVVGDSVTLTWSSTAAESLTATGDWSGALDPEGGSRTIEIAEAGDHTFTITADGRGGRTVASVVVGASLPPVVLDVSVPRAPVKAGGSVSVTATGLAPGETWTATIGRIRVATGAASAEGAVEASVRVPAQLAGGARKVVLTGSTAERTGSTDLSVVRAKRLKVSVSKKVVQRGKQQRVTVRGLAARESVTVKVLGRTFKGTANAKGVFTTKLKVTQKNAKKLGRKKVTAQGLDKSRTGTTVFRVKKK